MSHPQEPSRTFPNLRNPTEASDTLGSSKVLANTRNTAQVPGNDIFRLSIRNLNEPQDSIPARSETLLSPCGSVETYFSPQWLLLRIYIIFGLNLLLTLTSYSRGIRNLPEPHHSDLRMLLRSESGLMRAFQQHITTHTLSGSHLCLAPFKTP